MSRKRRRSAGTELQQLARTIARRQGDQRSALDQLHRIRAGHVAEAEVIARGLALCDQRVEAQLAAIEQGGPEWFYGRDGKIMDRFAPIAAALDQAFADDVRSDNIADRIAECDAIARTYHAGDRRGADGATPEMIAKIRAGTVGDPVTRLESLGHLSDEDVRDCREIERIWSYVSQGRGAAMMNFAVASELGPSDARQHHGDDDWCGLLHAYVYRPWCERAGEGARMALELAVEGVSLEDIRKRHKMSWASALAAIDDALALYRRIRRDGLREV